MRLKHKVFLFMFIGTLFSAISLHAQQLVFCEKVDGAGNPVNINTTFTVPRNGGPVTLRFTAPEGNKISNVNFDIYKLIDGKEVYHSTIKMPLTNSHASKQVIFYDEGRYRVYVFDDKDLQHVKGELTIKK